MRRIPGTFTGAGRKVLIVLPEIPDAADAATKNGLAIRNACATGGRCPDCGAEPVFSVDGEGFAHLTFEHEDECGVLRDDGSIGGAS